MALLEAGDVDTRMADGVLTVAAGMGSDFEAGQVLDALAERMPNDVALIERYRAEARRLGDHKRGQAGKALDRFFAD